MHCSKALTMFISLASAAWRILDDGELFYIVPQCTDGGDYLVQSRRKPIHGLYIPHLKCLECLVQRLEISFTNAVVPNVDCLNGFSSSFAISFPASDASMSSGTP